MDIAVNDRMLLKLICKEREEKWKGVIWIREEKWKGVIWIV
jgi:hypothetical protein